MTDQPPPEEPVVNPIDIVPAGEEPAEEPVEVPVLPAEHRDGVSRSPERSEGAAKDLMTRISKTFRSWRQGATPSERHGVFEMTCNNNISFTTITQDA